VHMLMVVFRASLKERVHQLLHRCDVKAFTEVNETVGYGSTGPAEGLAFYPGTNSVILVALDDDHVARVTRAVKRWYDEAASHSGWEKPALRVFAWPAQQIA
jgi:nitrogen regulatory protein PII